MAYSLSSLIKLSRKEVANIVLNYQYKFNNSLDPIKAELHELKTRFTKIESDLAYLKKMTGKKKTLYLYLKKTKNKASKIFVQSLFMQGFQTYHIR